MNFFFDAPMVMPVVPAVTTSTTVLTLQVSGLSMGLLACRLPVVNPLEESVRVQHVMGANC